MGMNAIALGYWTPEVVPVSERTKTVVRWIVVAALVAFAYWCGWDGGYRMGRADADLDHARSALYGR